MRANEILNELADKPYELLQSVHSAEMSKFKFITDTDLQYVVQIKPIMWQDTPEKVLFQYNALLVMFAVVDHGEMDDKITGRAGRDAFRVFATVLSAVKSSLKHRNQLPIKYLKFTGLAEEQSRISLYERIIKNIGRYLPGWEFHTIEQDGGYVSYIAKKKDLA